MILSVVVAGGGEAWGRQERMLGDRDKNKYSLGRQCFLPWKLKSFFFMNFNSIEDPTSLSTEEFDMRFRHLWMTTARQI